MKRLDAFVGLLCGRFDNTAQLEALRDRGVTDFPLAEHVNTACNDKITGLPEAFAGVFVVEESYYTTNGRTHASHHLFLFTEEDGGVKLTSYELPEGYDKAGFTYEKMGRVPHDTLRVSKTFNPALYRLKDGVWEGGSVSMFSPALKFTLFERFSQEALEVSESMERNGTRTFGYDEPIRYRRTLGVNAD